MSVKGRVKTIIMDKAPRADNLLMQQELGFIPGQMDDLAAAFNAEFGTNVSGTNLDNLQTVQDVVAYMESIIGQA